MKYCITTFNWDSLVVKLSIVCGARYAISDCLVSRVRNDGVLGLFCAHCLD